jgi:hypothetical protein
VYDQHVPGAPQLREAAWLVPDETVPRDDYAARLLFVRLEEQMDDPHGWTLELFQIQRPNRKARRWYATEAEARTALQAVYTLGEAIGVWWRSKYPGDAELQAQQSTSRSSPGFPRTKPRRAG